MAEESLQLKINEYPKEATIEFDPPDYLRIKNDGNMAVEWEMWIKQYEWFEIATKLKNQEEDVQVATFMSLIGSEAIKIFNTFRLSNADANNLQVIKKMFTEYFIPKSHVTYERLMFFKMEFKPEYTVDGYVRALKQKCRYCEFGELEDSFIRDKLIIGIKNDIVRLKLLSEEDLTLQRAIEICKTSEQASKLLKSIKASDLEDEDLLKEEPKKRKHKKMKCRKCLTSHSRYCCPAYYNECVKCNKKGHFESCCTIKETQSVSTFTEELVDEEEEPVD